MEKYSTKNVHGTSDENLKIAVVGAGLVSVFILCLFWN